MDPRSAPAAAIRRILYGCVDGLLMLGPAFATPEALDAEAVAAGRQTPEQAGWGDHATRRNPLEKDRLREVI